MIGTVKRGVEEEGRAVRNGGVEEGARLRTTRGVGDAYLDGSVYPQTAGREGYPGGLLVAVEPGGEARDGLGAPVQRKSPLVDELRVKTVHQETSTHRLDGGGDGVVAEAILHAKDEPFDGR